MFVRNRGDACSYGAGARIAVLGRYRPEPTDHDRQAPADRRGAASTAPRARAADSGPCAGPPAPLPVTFPTSDPSPRQSSPPDAQQEQFPAGLGRLARSFLAHSASLLSSARSSGPRESRALRHSSDGRPSSRVTHRRALKVRDLVRAIAKTKARRGAGVLVTRQREEDGDADLLRQVLDECRASPGRRDSRVRSSAAPWMDAREQVMGRLLVAVDARWTSAPITVVSSSRIGPWCLGVVRSVAPRAQLCTEAL